MNDPRLEQWLAATRRALAAPDESLAQSLEQALAEREALQRSLETRPAAPLSQALGQALADTEHALADRLDELRVRMRSELERVRQARSAASGYRPLQSNYPAFVSKSI